MNRRTYPNPADVEPLLLGVALAGALAGIVATVARVSVLRGAGQHLLEHVLRDELRLGGTTARQKDADSEQPRPGGLEAARTQGEDGHGRCSSRKWKPDAGRGLVRWSCAGIAGLRDGAMAVSRSCGVSERIAMSESAAIGQLLHEGRV